jgi:hypothetical protein
MAYIEITKRFLFSAYRVVLNNVGIIRVPTAFAEFPYNKTNQMH